MSLPADDFIQNIILKLAEYINTQTYNNVSNTSTSSIDIIVDQLSSKLDHRGLDLNDNDQEAIRATTKVLLKNLPVIIHTIISNINKVNRF
jgi:hypothetical protein